MSFAKSLVLRRINKIVLGIYLYYKTFSPLPSLTTQLPSEWVCRSNRQIAGSLEIATNSETAASFQVLKNLWKLLNFPSA